MGNEPSKQVKRRTSSSSLSSEENAVATRGNAFAKVVNDGRAAVAMAQGPKGAAYAYDDGRHRYMDAVGNGVAAVGGGMAYASVGSKNQAVAYSGKAAKAARLEWEQGRGDRKRIK